MRKDAKSEPVSKRVTVRLCSGLGNQLFQFVCGLAQSRRWQTPLSFDTTWYELIARMHTPLRDLRLGKMGLLVHEAFKGWPRWGVGLAAAAFDRTYRGRAFLEMIGKMTVIQETKPLRRQRWPDQAPANHVYLNGYWQTADHFLSVQDEMQRMIHPTAPLSSDADALIAKASTINTGFIHVRRGDYIHFMGDTGLLPVGYYSRSFSAMQGLGKNINRWMIFSEDAAWAQANLSFIPNAEIIDYGSPNRDIEDLMIMKSCSAGIIANSSYSWWGAALGDRSDRPIITPDRYWKDSGWDSQGWALPEWIRVKAWD